MKQMIGRLAMRVEGNYWNAYYALPDTMQDAVLIGSIALAAVPPDSPRKGEFMGMMRDIVADIIEERAGVRPSFNDPQRAPEHERAGRA